MRRPRNNDREVKATIAEAAEELFASRGFAGTSIRDIAAKAGVTGAMIHYYFGSKEGLYRTLLESAVAEVRALLKETAGRAEPAKARLERFIKVYSAYIVSHPNMVRIMNREMLTGGKHLEAAARRPGLKNNYRILRGLIAEGVRRGELRPVDIDLTPVSLIGMILLFQIGQPFISSALNDRYDERFVKRLSAHTIDLFLNGVNKGGRSESNKQSTRRVK